MQANFNTVEDYIDKRVNYEIQKYKDNIILLKKGLYEFIPEKNKFIFRKWIISNFK